MEVEFQIRIPFKVTFAIKSRDVVVVIDKNHLKVGLKGQPPVIDGELAHAIKVDDATWVIEDGKSGHHQSRKGPLRFRPNQILAP